MEMELSPREELLDVVVRFSTSIPDVLLHVDTPSTTSGATLKQRIRDAVQSPASTSRLRLIHSGKVLGDNASLTKSLNILQPPPTAGDGSKSEKAKGKQPVRDKAASAERVYVHCSVGDPLTPSELAAEQKVAADADHVLRTPSTPSFPSTEAQARYENISTTTPAPRGFDRLLSAGFTAAEIATLRAQFLAIQSHTHTPETMPSGAELLSLEERWLDNGSNSATAGGDGGVGGFEADDTGRLEDILYGNLVGFFWPLGAVCWLMREEGVWTRRRQIAVLTGFLTNLAIGFLRVWN